MTKVIATLKAILTRLMFSIHSVIAVWQVTQFKKDQRFWILTTPVGVLFLEGLFTLTVKKNQEWRWFCPSVFLYLSSVVPSIWILELDKVERRIKVTQETVNVNFDEVGKDLESLDKYLGIRIKLPDLQVDAETWVTVIEQLLMLILIIGRWMLPKGDLTRDQLSQLLLVYIGTAADIIEFFDSFKDTKISGDSLLVYLTLSIWSWSLFQFTIVLSATRSRKPRGGGNKGREEDDTEDCCGPCCCGIDAWGIALNIILQDAPFLTFRLLIIIQYQIVSYMNIFFTCKNTLVILLQLYRLHVVHSEKRKIAKLEKKRRDPDTNNVFVISNSKLSKSKTKRPAVEYVEESSEQKQKSRKKLVRDTGYSTGSSSNEESEEVIPKKNKSRCNQPTFIFVDPADGIELRRKYIESKPKIKNKEKSEKSSKPEKHHKRSQKKPKISEETELSTNSSSD